MGFGGRKTSEEPTGETKGRDGHCNIMSTSEPCAVFTGTEATLKWTISQRAHGPPNGAVLQLRH